MVRWVVAAAIYWIIIQLPIDLTYYPDIPSWSGRIIESDIHVGLRPAYNLGEGVGFTIQISTDVL